VRRAVGTTIVVHGIVQRARDCCSECGEPTPELLTGGELEVVALEIEQ
jgi:hypothetical protein